MLRNIGRLKNAIASNLPWSSLRDPHLDAKSHAGAVIRLYEQINGEFREAAGAVVCEAASAYLFSEAGKNRLKLDCYDECVKFVKHQGGLEHEQCGLIYVDNDNRVLHVQLMYGTLDRCFVAPREVVKAALRANAAGAIMFHNHPSGSFMPTEDDYRITKDVKASLALIGVTLFDHIIVTSGGSRGMAAHGEGGLRT